MKIMNEHDEFIAYIHLNANDYAKIIDKLKLSKSIKKKNKKIDVFKINDLIILDKDDELKKNVCDENIKLNNDSFNVNVDENLFFENKIIAKLSELQNTID